MAIYFLILYYFPNVSSRGEITFPLPKHLTVCCGDTLLFFFSLINCYHDFSIALRGPLHLPHPKKHTFHYLFCLAFIFTTGSWILTNWYGNAPRTGTDELVRGSHSGERILWLWFDIMKISYFGKKKNSFGFFEVDRWRRWRRRIDGCSCWVFFLGYKLLGLSLRAPSFFFFPFLFFLIHQ
jgi:hypothetical protein